MAGSIVDDRAADSCTIGAFFCFRTVKGLDMLLAVFEKYWGNINFIAIGLIGISLMSLHAKVNKILKNRNGGADTDTSDSE